MSALQRISNELISHIDMSDPLVKQRVEDEINELAHTLGIHGVNNLENFYRIWFKHKHEKGDDNMLNSWLAYYIGLTNKKPDDTGIPDRRVYARASFPDIDTDFDYLYQETIFNYLAKKYGKDFVGRTGTYLGLKMRTALTRIIKALDLGNAFHLGPKEFVSQNVQKVNEILQNIPRPKGTQALKVKDSDGKLITIKTIKDAYKHFKDFAYYMDKSPYVMQHSEHIEGLLSAFGRHPAGICLSDIPLYELCPFRPAKKGKDEGQDYVTQFVYEDLELMGLIKFDILAISTLTTIDRTLKSIKSTYGIDIDVENMDFKDEKTFQLFRSGNLIGVFQCEGWGMQETMKSIHVDSFEDIAVALALYRPGPMDSIPEYAARKLGGKSVDYFHPSIEPFVKPYLESTYGVLCFQEQVMQVFESLADIPKTDAYELIKGIGKKQLDLIVKFKQRFIDGCGKNKIPAGVATSYWENFIIPFASYGFNLAHAECYAVNAYICAYLKAHYPEEYMISLLNVENFRKKHDKIETLEKDLKRSGVKLLRKNINKCGVEYRLVQKRNANAGIVQSEISPTIMVKGVGYNAAVEIEKHQPYGSLREFAEKTSSKAVDQDTVGSLFEAGFFDGYRKKYKQKFKQTITRDMFAQKFSDMRKDLKKVSNSGKKSEDLFGKYK